MEQQFHLKEYGGFSLDEMSHLTGEERQWWMNRLQKKHEQEQEAAKSASGSNNTIAPSPGSPPQA